MDARYLQGKNGIDLPEAFVEIFRLAALQAGCVARRLQDEISLHHKKGDSDESTALTAADLAAQDVILTLFHHSLPHIAVDAEEDTPLVKLFPAEDGVRPLVIIDPVDGTLNYSRGSEEYAVMAALCLEGVYRASVVLLPARDTIYWTTGEEASCRQGGGATRPCRITATDETVLVTPFVEPALGRRLEGAGFATALSRCSAVDGLAPVLGRAGAAVSSRLDRRSAVAWPITLAAGGTVLIDGKPWQGEDPANRFGPEATVVVAGTRSLAERLVEVLKS